MTVYDAAVVVLVGPADVVGPHDVPADLAAEALSCIDDELALVEDRAVPVDTLWSEVLATALGTAAATAPSAAAVVLVCPSWWTRRRVDRVRVAVDSCSSVTVLGRADILQRNGVHVVVEVAPEFVVVHLLDGLTEVVPRAGETSRVADAVVEHLRDSVSVMIDTPARVAGAEELGAQVTRQLRVRGVMVTVLDEDEVIRAARAQWARSGPRAATERLGLAQRLSGLDQPRLAIAVGVVLSVAVLACASLWPRADRPAEPSLTWLVEGRVAVEVPAEWRTERIEVGPGSARVEVRSPVEPRLAIHITQSRVPVGLSSAAAADMVRTALAEQADGVFGDFDPAARVGDQPAITYRETRADRRVDWTLKLDDGVRIAIGCQGASDLPAPGDVCEHAISSAHTWE